MPVDYKAPILVVDDDATMLDLVVKMLSRLGFQRVDHASTVTRAESMIRSEGYQLVISDLYLKPGGGLELLTAIRSDDKLHNTPFLLMTGSVEASLAASLCGANDFILKPFTPEQLKAKLGKLLGRDARVA
jgi:DNA-binding response OmpR family regulator